MNGEIYQICQIAVAAKKALKTQSVIGSMPTEYERGIAFQFLPMENKRGTKGCKTDSVEQWYRHCLDNGLQEIMFIPPDADKNPHICGFVDTTQSALVCFWGERVTYFTARWKYISSQKMWDVLYTEQQRDDTPLEKSRFQNNSEYLKATLLSIKDLAYRLECDNFAGVFQKALGYLSDSKEDTDEGCDIFFSKLPEENLRLFKCAATASVFGGMGSWNDGPDYMAHKKGLDKKYDDLSNELLKQIGLALLFAINEW